MVTPRKKDSLRWTEEGDALISRMFREGKTAAVIAAATGRTKSACRNRLKRLGLTHAPCRGKSNSQEPKDDSRQDEWMGRAEAASVKLGEAVFRLAQRAAERRAA